MADNYVYRCNVLRVARKFLDKDYHDPTQYSATRIELQDRIVAFVLDTSRGSCVNIPTKSNLCPLTTLECVATAQKGQWLVLMAGPMGSGKTYTAQWLQEKGYMNLEAPVTIDMDYIRTQLPDTSNEFSHDTARVWKETHKESGLIAELALSVALAENRSVVFDGTLNNVEWYSDLILRVKETHPAVCCCIVHVWSDTDTLLRRCNDRARVEGRLVPRSAVHASQVVTLGRLQPLLPCMDLVLSINNTGVDVGAKGSAPVLVYPEGMSWRSVRAVFASTVASDASPAAVAPCNEVILLPAVASSPVLKQEHEGGHFDENNDASDIVDSIHIPIKSKSKGGLVTRMKDMMSSVSPSREQSPGLPTMNDMNHSDDSCDAHNASLECTSWNDQDVFHPRKGLGSPIGQCRRPRWMTRLPAMAGSDACEPCRVDGLRSSCPGGLESVPFALTPPSALASSAWSREDAPLSLGSSHDKGRGALDVETQWLDGSQHSSHLNHLDIGDGCSSPALMEAVEDLLQNEEKQIELEVSAWYLASPGPSTSTSETKNTMWDSPSHPLSPGQMAGSASRLKQGQVCPSSPRLYQSTDRAIIPGRHLSCSLGPLGSPAFSGCADQKTSATARSLISECMSPQHSPFPVGRVARQDSMGVDKLSPCGFVRGTVHSSLPRTAVCTHS